MERRWGSFPHLAVDINFVINAATFKKEVMNQNKVLQCFDKTDWLHTETNCKWAAVLCATE